MNLSTQYNNFIIILLLFITTIHAENKSIFIIKDITVVGYERKIVFFR